MCDFSHRLFYTQGILHTHTLYNALYAVEFCLFLFNEIKIKTDVKLRSNFFSIFELHKGSPQRCDFFYFPRDRPIHTHRSVSKDLANIETASFII